MVSPPNGGGIMKQREEFTTEFHRVSRVIREMCFILMYALYYLSKKSWSIKVIAKSPTALCETPWLNILPKCSQDEGSHEI